jgi:predicted CoA-binding protein
VAGENLLRNAKTIAVVGLSSRRSRPSYGVSEYMQSSGYRIIPVNPNETEVLGEKSWASLDEVPERVDIVDIFRRPECVPEIVDAAIRIGAKGIWMQEGLWTGAYSRSIAGCWTNNLVRRGGHAAEAAFFTVVTTLKFFRHKADRPSED